jgi:hypothetical protein
VHLDVWVAVSRRRIFYPWTSLPAPFISAERLSEHTVENEARDFFWGKNSECAFSVTVVELLFHGDDLSQILPTVSSVTERVCSKQKF